MTIGERLEEARKRKGISIREAAEATKIRADYLMAMEDGSMTVPLPEIYRRGFLRNYAKFLRLDPDQILTDYETNNARLAQQAANQSHRGGGLRETFGRMELPGQEDVLAESEYTGRPRRQGEEEEDRSDAKEKKEDTSKSLPIPTSYLMAAVGVVAFVIVGILVWLIVLLSRGDSSPEVVSPPTTQGQSLGGGPRPLNSSPYATDSLIIRATDTVTLIVTNDTTGERLFRGTLLAGESTDPIPRNGPLQIRFTDGEALVLEYDGQQHTLQAGGRGYTTID
ncbi:MAG: helix-turn-helix domain-containing protein [Verrucomicrobiota bacterium JB022]|nr:helix-turn-helix domain-containing protein [Verrucomicrobiota bacterium JB022]